MDTVETFAELGDPNPIVGAEPVDDLFDGGEGHGFRWVGLRPLHNNDTPLCQGCQPPPLGFSSRHGAALVR